jgi:hypothetical protein
LVGFPPVTAENVGLKASAPQFSTWNGEESTALAVAPPGVNPPTVDSTASWPQFVGLRSKPWRLIVMFSARIRIGMPPTIVGTLVSVAITWAVSDLTLILARAITFGSVNGPAIGETTIDRPNGAPSNGPVR